jgi:4-carboxymuconolactone decarboxylase
MIEDLPSAGGRVATAGSSQSFRCTTQGLRFRSTAVRAIEQQPPFRLATGEGRLIGPFNPALGSPEISLAFHSWQAVEEECSSLNARVRQVVVLAVNAVWQAEYELYAHAAVARATGFTEEEMPT